MMVRLTALTAVLILSMAADENRDKHFDCEELHAAAYMDEPVELVRLIDHGTSLECRDVIYQTPLITATDGASLSAFTILLARGADISARDEIGETALDKAKQKLAFFDMPGGAAYRKLYQRMIDLLKAAGTTK